MENLFDPLRRKYVALTPEEHVRQQFIQYLNQRRNWPLSVMGSEKEIQIGTQSTEHVKFRCDIVCYAKRAGELTPQMIVECKAPDIKITQKTFEQIWRYALILKVKWICITNGRVTHACQYNPHTKAYEYINDVPFYPEPPDKD